MLTLLLESAVEMTFADALSMVRSIGSNNHVPDLPLLALVLTTTVGAKLTCPLELVSIKPPLPERAPPNAFSVPATEVLSCDQIAMMPPLPACVAEALTIAPWATVTVFANSLLFAAVLALALVKAWACALLN